ncbi:MAG: hypothetical protein K1X47_07270 [Cyclobacteriaceae bacterium]|nr:hypothetical protein [Cyclobacteriaceae bacterium]
MKGRQVISILFAALVLFNTLGYYGLFWGLEYRNTRIMVERLDNDAYDASATMTLRIPITMPYTSDTRDFVRVDGVVEYNGQQLRMVKQRIQHDTLHIVVLKDEEANRLTEVKDQIAQSFSDKPANHQTARTLSALIKDYLPQVIDMTPVTAGWQQVLYPNTFVPSAPAEFHPAINHPPEMA